jgi:hypothetical protein
MKARRLLPLAPLVVALALVGPPASAEVPDPPFDGSLSGRFGDAGAPIAYRFTLKAKPGEKVPFVISVAGANPRQPFLESALGLEVQWKSSRGVVHRDASTACASACGWTFYAPELKEAPIGGEYTLYVRDESPRRGRRPFKWLVTAARAK